jgi:hypothetical protein
MTRIIIVILGSVCGGIGMMSVAGYVFNISKLYNWNGQTPMAINTAVACVLIGIYIIYDGTKSKKDG